MFRFQGSRQRGFTLVELLVVIGIIALLAGILVPTIGSIIDKAERVQAQADVKGLATAWKEYYNEYGRWPVDGNVAFSMAPSQYRQNAGEASAPPSVQSTGILMVVKIMTNIMYADIGVARINMDGMRTNYNPKMMTFMDYRTESLNTSGDFVDPWGYTYRVLFDANGSGTVEPAWTNVVINERVIAWSVGQDGRNSDDDITSWK